MSAIKSSKTRNASEWASYLQERAVWVRSETLRIHKSAPETRVASSLSAVEILTALYYGEILRFDSKQQYWEGRDRFIVSKGHGSISMYPILADFGFFPRSELEKVCKEGGILGGIPDPIIPGYETINGSLGHGVGVACGMALALRTKKCDNDVFVLVGDGELNEGSIWESIMFASHHGLDRLNLIVDRNQKCMLDYADKVINMSPMRARFEAFGFHVEECDGHDVMAVHERLTGLRNRHEGKPKILIAETVKGKGVRKLEASPLCHITGLTTQEIDEAIEGLKS